MYEIIKHLCKQKKISVYHLEKVLELSTGSVCKWQNSMPRADTLKKIADYFGVSVDFLLQSRN